ncbi:uncharacterized protein LOC131168110 isoform X1 [Malania oleifera]|uniref:uncharacterized protein LOC131168110 isoform X1 n=1 Tax=Malania oleifera TaxID=397392 RepID=UPI0025AE05D9|nr:uncharacterized protein LOC131168110 isoform X1 [Malania oleifera]
MLLRVIRSIHTTVDAPRLTRFSLNAPKNVEVEFANSSVFNLSAEFLRIHSPAADSKVRSVGGEKVIFGTASCGDHVCRAHWELRGWCSMTYTKLGFIHGIISIILEARSSP